MESVEVRRRKIWANLLAGLSVSEVAEAINAPVEEVVEEAVGMLDRMKQDTAVLGEQVDTVRLNRATNAIWGRVQEGDLAAIEALIKIISERRKIEAVIEADSDPFPAGETVPGQVESRQAYRQLEAVAGETEWYADYMALRQEKGEDGKARWDWRKAVYIAWASMPDSKKWPRTQKELAQGILGLKSTRTIRQWRTNDPEIEQRIEDLSGAPLLMKYRANVFQALAEVAQTPDAKGHSDRRLFLEITGDYRPRQRVEHSGPAGGPIEQRIDFEDWTEEELEQYILNIEAAMGRGEETGRE